MNSISCLIQADGSAAGREAELEQKLRDHHGAQCSGAEVAVSWRAVASDRMFTAGATSKTSVIACEVDGPTSRDQREAYMRGVCDLWTETTGCSDHDVVVSMTEAVQAASTEETS